MVLRSVARYWNELNSKGCVAVGGARPHYIISQLEHDSVQLCARAMEEEGLIGGEGGGGERGRGGEGERGRGGEGERGRGGRGGGGEGGRGEGGREGGRREGREGKEE